MKMNFRLNPRVLALIVYLLYLMIFTMQPFHFGVPSDVEYDLVDNTSVSHFILNVILFIPFGFLLFLLMRKAGWKDYVKILACGVSGVALSFFIETYQLFLYRSSELSDVLMNGVGAVTGALLSKFYGDKIIGTVRFTWIKVQSSMLLLAFITALYSMIVFILLVFPIRYVDLRNWNPDFPFQVGNEATLDRPWIGKVYLVAIYSRALSSEEVYLNFKAGHYSKGGDRIKDGLVAFYDFKEGSGKIINDGSSFDAPLDLTIYDPAKVRWLTAGGLEILDDAVIRSERSAEKLYREIKSANEFTVEVWALPGNILQDGPARIVSFSKNTNFRNFTLGQSGAKINFRVRTPLSGLNGTDKHLTTEDAILSDEIQHLTAVYRNGVEALFVNGLARGGLALYDDIKLLGIFGSGVISKMAFCFFFFFPLSFLSYSLFSNLFGGAKNSSLLSVLFNLGLLFIIETIYVLIFSHKDFDFVLLSLVVPIGIFSALFCKICAGFKSFQTMNS